MTEVRVVLGRIVVSAKPGDYLPHLRTPHVGLLEAPMPTGASREAPGALDALARRGRTHPERVLTAERGLQRPARLVDESDRVGQGHGGGSCVIRVVSMVRSP
jgi:hypothetical protein